MRTHPPSTPPVRRPRALAASLGVGLLLVLGAGCAGDEPEASAPLSSNTTAPDDTSTSEATTTSASMTTTTTEPVELAASVLDEQQVEAELRRILDGYTAAFVGATQRGALDEQLRGELAGVMGPELLVNELSGLEGIGGIDAVVATPGPIPLADVEVDVAIEDCASGSASIDLSAIVGDRVPGPRVMFFKIQPSEASGGTWRLTALGWTPDGQPFLGASCGDG